VKSRCYAISPARRLAGRVRISGSKHVAQRCLVASLLTEEPIVLENVPRGCRDPAALVSLLRKYGKHVDIDGDQVVLSGVPTPSNRGGITLGSDLRVTTLLLGPLLSWHDSVQVALPGGCRIGPRPVDLHELALRLLGAKVLCLDNGIIASRSSRLRGAPINLPLLSNGAAECAILAGCRAIGRTTITGVHVTPELVDLVALLTKMGARISVGYDIVVVDGVPRMHGAAHRVMPDTAEAVTYAIATMMVGGRVLLEDFPCQPLDFAMYRLSCIGGMFHVVDCGVIVESSPDRLSAFSITAGRYPAASSDSQPLFAALATQSNGTSRLSDERWPHRLSHVEPLRLMGATVSVTDGVQVIRGPQKIIGGTVTANDIRSGMAMLLAGLVSAEGAIINNAEQIERGYEVPATKFNEIGSEISICG
jgi:UDP-N-acetylglucosamine 1-carboxyvinyltransferase